MRARDAGPAAGVRGQRGDVTAIEDDSAAVGTQPLGFIHALFEVGLDALKRASSIDDKAAITAAIKATDLNTLVGPISWAKGPVPNVTKTPLVGGQWGKGKDVRFDMTIVSNRSATNIPTAGKLRPLKQA